MRVGRGITRGGSRIRLVLRPRWLRAGSALGGLFCWLVDSPFFWWPVDHSRWRGSAGVWGKGSLKPLRVEQVCDRGAVVLFEGGSSADTESERGGHGHVRERSDARSDADAN